MLRPQIPGGRVEDEAPSLGEDTLGEAKQLAADSLVLKLRLEEGAPELYASVLETKKNEATDEPILLEQLEEAAAPDRFSLPLRGVVAGRAAGAGRPVVDVVLEGAPRDLCQRLGIAGRGRLDSNFRNRRVALNLYQNEALHRLAALSGALRLPRPRP